VSPQRQYASPFRGLLEASPDAIVVAARDGTILVVNEHAEWLFGYEAGELVGASVETLVPAAARAAHARHRAAFDATPHRRPMGMGLALSGVRRDGSELPVEISLCPLVTEAGPVVIAAIRDVEGRVRTQRALEAANEELDAFSHSVSHDLRAPIRQIEGFARLLDEQCGVMLDGPGRHYLARILQGANHMDRLVEDLLQLAHLGQGELRAVCVALDALIAEVVEELRTEVGGREVAWHVAPLPEVTGDPGLLKIAFFNLLANAVKYTRRRDHAVIEVAPKPQLGGATIMIRDNGVGFDAIRATKLFGPFQRVHSSEDFEGQGIGLATVRRIVRRHGGDVWAESEPEAGATFYVRLPPRGPSTAAAA
jgi:PAS domain S-box-containing protein